MFNVLQRKYQEDFENMKDQIYFMQTETPEYKVNKQAGVAASKVWGNALVCHDGLIGGGLFVTLDFVSKEKKKSSWATTKKVLWGYNKATKFLKNYASMSINKT